jgi:hypothetical protein
VLAFSAGAFLYVGVDRDPMWIADADGRLYRLALTLATYSISIFFCGARQGVFSVRGC